MTLDRYHGSGLEQALSFAHLSEAQQKVRAVRAASSYNREELWVVVEAFLAAGTRTGLGASPHTRRSYKKGLEVFVDWAQNSGVTLLRPGARSGGAYSAHLQAQGLAPGTVGVRIAAAHTLYRALSWAGATDANPMSGAPVPRERTAAIEKRPPYTLNTLDALLREADPYERLLVLLTTHGALRIAEALGARRADLQGDRLLVRGKGGKQVRVKLSRRTLEALRQAPALTSGYLLPWRSYAGAYGRLNRLARRHGLIEGWRGFHGLRKRGATDLYLATRDFTRVARHVRHASVDTTTRYVQVPDDDLDAALDDL